MSRVSKFDHSQINLCDNRLIMDGSQKLKIKEIEPKARFHDELGVLKGKSLQSQILLIQGCENKPVSLKHVYHMTELESSQNVVELFVILSWLIVELIAQILYKGCGKLSCTYIT